MMLTAFTAGLMLITISELGDKTFFVAMILAMRHSKRWVFIGVFAALAAMTLLSVAAGQVVALLPKMLVYYAEVALLIGFGLKLLYDASCMSNLAADEEIRDAEEAVKESETKLPRRDTPVRVMLQAFVLTFIAEFGDRTQIATVTLAASNNPWGVIAGAVLGHAICTVIAVWLGCRIAGRISERTITAIGGLLFLVFGVAAAIEG